MCRTFGRVVSSLRRAKNNKRKNKKNKKKGSTAYDSRLGLFSRLVYVFEKKYCVFDIDGFERICIIPIIYCPSICHELRNSFLTAMKNVPQSRIIRLGCVI